MNPAVDDIELPPVRILASRSLKELTDRCIQELRAKGIPYEVIDLDEVLRR